MHFPPADSFLPGLSIGSVKSIKTWNSSWFALQHSYFGQQCLHLFEFFFSMEKQSFSAGNAGPDIRSDCRVTYTPSDEPLSVTINSKVVSMYGNSIRGQIMEILSFYDIRSGNILVEDSGALPFVIAARTEAAIRMATGSAKEFILPKIQSAMEPPVRDRMRLTRLYVPGNTPKLMINAGIHQPDGLILDLEDSVAPEKKFEARILVRNALCQVDFFGAERMVRINQYPAGREDLAAILPHNVHLILLPKTESADQISETEEFIKASVLTPDGRLPFLMPIIETALGIENAFSIASASGLVVAMAIGLEDYTADLGVVRTKEGSESLWARQRLVNACKAAGIQAIDSVFSDIDDREGLVENVSRSKALGFEGMGCIHPRQIETIRSGYLPRQDEIEKALRIVEAYNQALERGLGVVALGSKMIDAPVVHRALRTIDLARKFHLIDNNNVETHSGKE